MSCPCVCRCVGVYKVYKCTNKCAAENKGKLNPAHRKRETWASTHCLTFHPRDPWQQFIEVADGRVGAGTDWRSPDLEWGPMQIHHEHILFSAPILSYLWSAIFLYGMFSQALPYCILYTVYVTIGACVCVGMCLIRPSCCQIQITGRKWRVYIWNN